MVSPEVLTSARRLIAGDPQILARAISWVENGLDVGSDIYQEILPHCGNALVVGVTGPFRRDLAVHDRAPAAHGALVNVDAKSPPTAMR
jgi:hypothetical protein